MHWWLYLFLLGCPIKVHGHYDTLRECRDARDKQVADFLSIHKTGPAFGWCVQGGKDDLSG